MWLTLFRNAKGISLELSSLYLLYLFRHIKNSMNIRKHIWLAIFSIFVVTSSTILAANLSAKSGQSITLIGRLELQTAYGPPNFGENPETDRKETYIALVGFLPIDLTDENGVALTSAVRAQLITSSGDIRSSGSLMKLIGKDPVRIVGTIFPAVTGHHHERIILIVESMEK